VRKQKEFLGMNRTKYITTLAFILGEKMNNLALVDGKQKQVKELVCVSQSPKNQNPIIIQGRNYNCQKIEMTVQQSHPALRRASGAAFSLEVNYQERLVVVQEVKRTYLHNLDVDTVVRNIRSEILHNYKLSVYAIALLKTGSIPKTSSGEVDYHTCQNDFLNTSLDAIQTWTANPRQDLLRLQADVDALLVEIQLIAQQANFQLS
jgi:acyl-CoA synthetase (AMP-forming)/AMP-acid ligase II